MLKLGTIFSGIGAIEHALDRLNIPYQIEFACDNGDVDILSKSIDDKISAINLELLELRELLLGETKNRDWLPNALLEI